jgi:flavodoxin
MRVLSGEARVNGIVAFDSYHGNGAQVAGVIAEELRAAGHDVTEAPLHSRKPARDELAAAEFLVLGGPTRMKHISRRAMGLAKKLDAKTWSGRPALVYDTFGPLDPDPVKNEGNAWLYPGGVAELRQRLEEKGLDVAPIELRCVVKEMKGPLEDGALDDARAAARAFAALLAGAA